MRFARLAKGYPPLLVTGFGAFPGVRLNPSAALARAVARSPRWRLLGVETRALVLATTYGALATELEPALNRPDRPGAILMIGLAVRSKSVRVERRATARSNPLHPDAAGEAGAVAEPRPGPAAHRTVVPAPAVLALIARAGVRCRISHDAGRYLCNAAYYRALGEPLPVLFLHIPKLRDAARPRRARSAAAGQRSQDRLERACIAVAVALLTQARNRGRARAGSVAAEGRGR